MTLNSTLSKTLFAKENRKSATRDGFGIGLVEAARYHDKIVGMSADLTGSTRMSEFAKIFPKRFFNVGIAEQNMVGMAAGLALDGFTPFAASYGVFFGRAWDHIRIQVCLSNLNVKLVGTHAGLTVGADGATAQALEDISMLRALPSLTIVSPCDALEAKKAVLAIADMVGPVYLRLSREETPVITTERTPFVLGRPEIFATGKDLTIFSTGIMLNQALEAARTLEYAGVSAMVVNIHTIKPLEAKSIIPLIAKTCAAVVVEEHQIHGGLGSVLAEIFALNQPIPMEQVAVQDRFGQSGKGDELLKAYGLTAEKVVAAAKKVLQRKAAK
ncbi:MAG TPA: transketolase C-terminal domain-containing protein [Candidatus Saccharimonadia bacterium]|nr:transketolase C-terminal domain-containing protein [Candidatus Saccharimonadia bacterium]